MSFLHDKKYDEAITEFLESLKLKEDSIEVKMNLAKAYVGKKDINAVITVLEEVQNTDLTNEDLLKEILAISKEINMKIPYNFLERYINKVGLENASQEVQNIYNEANEVPIMALVDNATGTYNESVIVRLYDSLKTIGHTYYYTTDGTRPTKDYNGLGEVVYRYKVTDSYYGSSTYYFDTIGGVEVLGERKAIKAYISRIDTGSNNVHDVGSYLIYEDGCWI